MELKEYQSRALEAFVRWQESLGKAQRQSVSSIELLERQGFDIPYELRNYPKTAWDNLARKGDVPLSVIHTWIVPPRLATRFRMLVSRYLPAAARRCSGPRHWNGSTGDRAYPLDNADACHLPANEGQALGPGAFLSADARAGKRRAGEGS